jgi:hypothetical protein
MKSAHEATDHPLSTELMKHPKEPTSTLRRSSSQQTVIEDTGQQTKTIMLADGSHYAGQWLHGRMHGNGKHVLSEDTYYVGNFVNGKRQGKGLLSTPLGSCMIMISVHDFDFR